jgi:hypothetical protein
MRPYVCHLGLAARQALPRSRAAEKHTYFVHTQDGRIHLPTADTTPDPPVGQGGLTSAEFHRKNKTLFIRTTSGISVEPPASGTGLGAGRENLPPENTSSFNRAQGRFQALRIMI